MAEESSRDTMPEFEPDGLEEEDKSITVEVSWRRFAPRHHELIDGRQNFGVG
jgi:hypothetical protein